MNVEGKLIYVPNKLLWGSNT